MHKCLVLDLTCCCPIPKPVETLCVIFRGKLCVCSFVHVYLCVSIRSESAKRRRRGSVLRTCSEATPCSTSSSTAASRSRGGQKRDLYMTELLAFTPGRAIFDFSVRAFIFLKSQLLYFKTLSSVPTCTVWS